MYHYGYYLLVGLYAAAPPLTVLWAIRQYACGHAGVMVSTIFTLVFGLAVGSGLIVLNSKLMGGTITPHEGAKLVYVLVAAICMLKWLGWTMRAAVYRLVRVPLDRHGRPRTPARLRALVSALAQSAVLLAIAVSYGLSLLLVYRPKALLLQPATGHYPLASGTALLSRPPLNLNCSEAWFRTADGFNLAGWWIVPPVPSLADATPNQTASGGTGGTDHEENENGNAVVIICHGVGSCKERQVGLAWLLVRRGFNVLLFDFRGHGQSEGNLITYGDRERLDVLAAVRWLRQEHPDLRSESSAWASTPARRRCWRRPPMKPMARRSTGWCSINPTRDLTRWYRAMPGGCSTGRCRG